ncbi:hypothetical protein ACJW30_02G197400 [Castanea mollissima]
MRQEPLSNTSISLLGSRKLSYTESPIIPQIILKEEEEEKDVKKLASTWLQQGVTKYFPVLEGHPVGQTHAEHAVEAHGAIQSNIKRLMKEFKIYRKSISIMQYSTTHFHMVDYDALSIHYFWFVEVLDVLQKIKAEDDPSLTCRCREGICGSCAMNIDGTNTVACLKPIDPDTSRPTFITLLLYLTSMAKNEKAPEDVREYGQSPKNRKKLDGFYECILCACCTTSCPSYWWNPEQVLGPAALLQAYRWISDCRDDNTDERLQALTEDHRRLYRCRTIKNCTATCPRSLNPAYAIHKMKSKHLLSSPVARIETL